METQKKRTWAEVSLGNLAHNYTALRRLTPTDCKFMGMVKSNAYGHGAIPVAKKLEELGADYLGVACLDEAAELREAGITLPILVLGVTDPAYVPELLRMQVTQTVPDSKLAQELSDAAQKAGGVLKIHIKADTGMSRLGFLCDEIHLDESAEQIDRVCALPGLEAEGIFTHFSVADEDEEYTMHQFERFLSVMDKLKKRGRTFAIRHCANSAATLLYPSFHLDMIRPGIALYGHYPAPGMEELCPLVPVMEVKTRVSAVRLGPVGAGVSYGRTRLLDRDSTLAVIPIGYGDGFFRGFSDHLQVIVHGRKARIAGRICMDMCMVDVTDIPDVQPGDIVTVYGAEGETVQPVEDGADLVGTISYELLCALSPRIPRLYV